MDEAEPRSRVRLRERRYRMSHLPENILSHIAGGGNFIVQVSANDLREVIRELYEDERKRTEEAIKAHRERPTLTRKEAAKMLGVILSTLWKWDKNNYLKPVKIGTKVLYRLSDIEAILTQKA